jgi:hypothetical protein
MKDELPYNPLDKIHLGESVANAILSRAVVSLPPDEPFSGAGIYAIYYTGTFSVYAQIAERNKNGRYEWPIYVGKAIPQGARRGGVGVGVNANRVLFKRLGPIPEPKIG